MNGRALLAAALIGVGCSSRAQPPSAPAAPAEQQRPALHRGPLTDYVAAAGLRWMVVGSPAKLLANADVARSLSRLIPPERLDRFARGSGLDLRKTESALVAGFDYATLYAASHSGSTVAIEQRFVDRLLSGPIVAHPVPGIRRYSGVVGSTPQTLLVIDDQLVAVSVGDPTPIRVAEAYARGKLRRSPVALRGSSLSTLPASVHAAAVRFYAPGPFAGEWTLGARGLLAGALALGVAADPLPNGQIAAQVQISGDFGSDSDARAALLAAFRDLSESSLGKLLGFDRPAADPVLSAARDLLTLDVVLELEPIARGLHAAVSADVWEMLELSAPKAPGGMR